MVIDDKGVKLTKVYFVNSSSSAADKYNSLTITHLNMKLGTVT